APVNPRPASAVIQSAARLPEDGRDDQIGGVSSDRVPVGKRKLLIVQHLANDPLELVKHESMPRQEIPLLIMLRVGGIAWMRLAAVPPRLGEVPLIWRECRDDFRFLFPG